MAEVEIEGVAPLLMHNIQLVNPLNEWTQKIKAVTAKKTGKTDGDLKKLQEYEFQGGLYFDDKEGPYIPAVNIEGLIRDGARISSKGKTIESGLQVEPQVIPLKYKGPRKRDGLFKKKEFIDTRGVKLRGKAIMRTRPRFEKWSLSFKIMIIDEIAAQNDIMRYLQKAGMVKGLGDFKPRFGRFIVKKFEWV